MSRRVRRREFLRTSLAGVGTAALGVAACDREAPQAAPSFVLILSDQQHWQALGCVDPFFETPNLDLFASGATQFERAFCTSPQCSPSRSSILTGLYPTKTGVLINLGLEGARGLTQPGLGAMLQQAGYRTAYLGKWHLGEDPRGRAGWDRFVPDIPDRQVTERSLGFLEEAADAEEPFLLVASYVNPHDIYKFSPATQKVQYPGTPLPASWSREDLGQKPPPQWQFMTQDQGLLLQRRGRHAWQAYREFYRECVRLFDVEVGRLLLRMRSLGIHEKAIIITTSDHGDMDANHRLVLKGPFMYDHVMRVPMLVSVPRRLGGWQGRVDDQDMVHVDLVPTIRDFAGLPPAASDGLSLRPRLTGGVGLQRRQEVIGQYHGKQDWITPIRSIRHGNFKFNRYLDLGDELYDLACDPDELINLGDDPRFTAVKDDLVRRLDGWMQNNQDPFYSLQATPLNPMGPGGPRIPPGPGPSVQHGPLRHKG